MSDCTIFNINKEIYEIRNEIRKMLSSTKDLDPELKDVKSVIRYYYMTMEEFEKLKPYTFTVLLGNLGSDYVEGFCYDIIRVNSEEYFKLDLKIPYVPINLSPARWKAIVTKYPDMFKYSREAGKLSYPLTKKELEIILEGVIGKNMPVICSYDDGCKVVSVSELEFAHQNTLQLFDESQVKRYGPKDVLKTEKKGQTSTGWNVPVKTGFTDEEIKQKIALVVEDVRNQLSQISLLYPKVDQFLQSEKEKEWMESLLKSSTEVEQVAGIILDEVISAVLEDKLKDE